MTAQYCPKCGALVAIGLHDNGTLCATCEARDAQAAIRRYAELLRKVEAERDGLREELGRVLEWTHRYGKMLIPKGGDTYGEGMRDAKDQVSAILEGGN